MASGEIYQSYLSTATLYALITRPSDKYIWDAGDEAFEAVGTWNDTRIGQCDIPMTAAGDMHYVDFPAAITTAGVYLVQIRLQAGASPDTDDIILSQGFMEWDGAAEITASVIDTNVDYLITSEGKIDNVIQTIEVPEGTDKARIYI